MATKIPNKWGKVIRNQPIGDKLNEEFFSKGADGAYSSFTGYTMTAVMYDGFDTLVASPTVTIADGVPPDETATVTDGKVTISDVPADLPIKEGEYTVWVTQTADGDATDIVTFIEMQINFVPKKFSR